jgi:hypothetical protein
MKPPAAVFAILSFALAAAAAATPSKRAGAIQVGAVETFNRDECGGRSLGILGYDINISPPFEDGGCARNSLSQNGQYAWSVYVSDLSRGCAGEPPQPSPCDVVLSIRGNDCVPVICLEEKPLAIELTYCSTSNLLHRRGLLQESHSGTKGGRMPQRTSWAESVEELFD